MDKLALLWKCVDSKEQYDILLGPLFSEFNLLYKALKKSNVKIEDIEKITYESDAQNVEFTVIGTKEKGSEGLTLSFPITGGGFY